jgi:hypothetical protein
MHSVHFLNLTSSVQELKRIYLNDALAAAVPTPDHQELARAFVALTHSELEYYVEEACRGLAQDALKAAVVGNYGKASIAMITFSGLEARRGGSMLRTFGKKKARRLSMRFGEAYDLLIKAIDGNNGVREKHLAALAIPLGLDASRIDNTWLNELDAFCSSRGAFAHMSRTSQRGSHLAVNPHDVWHQCERVIWTIPALAVQGVINSFESLDDWIEGEKQSFGPYVPVAAWRLRLTQFLFSALSRPWRRDEAVDDDDY